VDYGATRVTSMGRLQGKPGRLGRAVPIRIQDRHRRGLRVQRRVDRKLCFVDQPAKYKSVTVTATTSH